MLMSQTQQQLPQKRQRQRTPRVTGEHLQTLEAYAAFFNNVAKLPINQRTVDQRFYIVAHFRPRPGDRILDVGAYLGNNLRRYAEDGHEIDGLEIGKAYCDIWEQRSMEMEPEDRARTRMFCVPFEEWEADRTYDQIICTEVIEHVIDPQGFVLKMSGLLNLGGQLFLATPRTKTRTAAREVGPMDLRLWTSDAGLSVERMFVAIPRKEFDSLGVPNWICIAERMN